MLKSGERRRGAEGRIQNTGQTDNLNKLMIAPKRCEKMEARGRIKTGAGIKMYTRIRKKAGWTTGIGAVLLAIMIDCVHVLWG